MVSLVPIIRDSTLAQRQRDQACVFSAGLAIAGMALSSKDDEISQIAGGCMIRAGVSGGCYAWYDADFDPERFFLKSFTGLTTGLLTGIMGNMIYESKGTLVNQLIFSVIDRVSSLFLTKVLMVKPDEKTELPKGREILGSVAELGFNEAFNRFGLPLVRQAIFPVREASSSAKIVFFNSCIPSVNALFGRGMASLIEGNFWQQNLVRVFCINACTHGIISIFREAHLFNRNEIQERLLKSATEVKKRSDQLSKKYNRVKESNQLVDREHRKAIQAYFEAWDKFKQANDAYQSLMLEAKGIQKEEIDINHRMQAANMQIKRAEETMRQEEHRLHPIVERLQSIAGRRCYLAGNPTPYTYSTAPALKVMILEKFAAGETVTLEWEVTDFDTITKSVQTLDAFPYYQACISKEESLKSFDQAQADRLGVQQKATALKIPLQAAMQGMNLTENLVKRAREDVEQTEVKVSDTRALFRGVEDEIDSIRHVCEEPIETKPLPLQPLLANIPVNSLYPRRVTSLEKAFLKNIKRWCDRWMDSAGEQR